MLFLTHDSDDEILVLYCDNIRVLVVGGSVKQVFLKLKPLYFKSPAVPFRPYIDIYTCVNWENKQTIISLNSVSKTYLARKKSAFMLF